MYVIVSYGIVNHIWLSSHGTWCVHGVACLRPRSARHCATVGISSLILVNLMLTKPLYVQAEDSFCPIRIFSLRRGYLTTGV